MHPRKASARSSKRVPDSRPAIPTLTASAADWPFAPAIVMVALPEATPVIVAIEPESETVAMFGALDVALKVVLPVCDAVTCDVVPARTVTELALSETGATTVTTVVSC